MGCTRVRRDASDPETWLKALYPWVFGQAFFDTPEKTEMAIAAALAYPYAQSADAMAHQMEALRTFRPQSKLDAIPCPVHVMYAGQDLLVPPSASRPSFAKIPDLTETTIDHAGHSIAWDAPEEVIAHMRVFLDAHPIS